MKRAAFHTLKSIRADEQGSVLTFWAIALGVFMGLIALSIDFGRSATTQSELQGFADNVALAAAGELNSQSDSITRATLAAQTLISDTQTFGDGDQILSDDGDFELTFYSSPPTPTDPGVETSDSIIAGYVKVTATQQNVVAFFGNAFSALTGEDAGGGNVGAEAVAGFTQYACDISPMMFCAPSINFRADDNAGSTVLLRTGGNNAAWIPGSFGWLDPAVTTTVDEDGVCAGLTGSELDICLISAAGNRTSCYEQNGISPAGGQHGGNFEAALNIRFDIYQSGAGKFEDHPDYPPAPNVLHSYETMGGGNNQCIGGNGGELSATQMGMPPDDCHLSGTCDRFGNGDWSLGRAAYVAVNYGGIDPHPDAITRYDYYLAEISAMASLNPATILDGMRPQCSSVPAGDPDRRVLVAASVDCLGLSLQDDGDTVAAIEFVELFMVAPVGLDGSKDVWVEIIGTAGGGSGGANEEARFREVVQLYK